MSKFKPGIATDKPSYLHKQERIRTRSPDITWDFATKVPGHKVTLIKGTKPPKMKFKIGSYLRYEGYLYEVMYAYRVASDPHEWIYSLEVRKNLAGQLDAIGELASAMGCGKDTPRIVYDLFQNPYEANYYFQDIPMNGDRILRKNKDLMAKAEVVSSGQVIK